MAKVDIPITVTIDLNETGMTGLYINVNTWISLQSGLRWKRGTGVDHNPEISTCSFVLDNADETWTPNNTSSTYFNRLKAGMGVEVSSNYGGVVYHFRGVIMSFAARFPDAGWGLGVQIECEGMVSLLRKYTTYNMALQTNLDVDGAMAAIMVACGVPTSLYSFQDSAFIVPLVYPRSDALTDLIDVAKSELFGLVFEDGQGRLRLKNAASMRGGYVTPTHTWGNGFVTTIIPEGDITPDYRHEDQFARIQVTASVHKSTEEFGILYQHTPNADTGLPESIAAGAVKRIKFRSDKMPITYTKTFSTAAGPFWIDTGDDLAAASAPNGAMNATQTTLTSYSPSTATAYSAATRPVEWGSEFAPGMYIRVDNEIMIVLSMTTTATYGQVLSVSRGEMGTTPTTHAANASISARAYTESWGTYPSVDPSTYVGNADAALTATATAPPPDSYDRLVFTANSGSLALRPGDILLNYSNSEKIMVRSTITEAGITVSFDVVRGARDTTPVAQAAGRAFYRLDYVYDATEIAGNPIYSSESSTGIPSEPGGIEGLNTFESSTAAILFSGREGVADIKNNAAGTRWLASLEISGSYVDITETPMTATFELPIPNVIGVPDGPSIDIPFGLSDMRAVEAYAVGLLGAGRYPSPWITLEFTANLSTNTSILAAEIGDLVHYKGTGTRREKIDEYFRIMAIEGAVNEYSETIMRFVLAPSNLWRAADRTWFTMFSQQAVGSTLGLGAFEVDSLAGVPAGWNGTDGQWDNWQPTGATPAAAITYGNAPGAAGTESRVDMSSADMVVAAKWDLVSETDNTWEATSTGGGFGILFRGDLSTGGHAWAAVFRPGTGVYLWNSVAGMVGSAYPYTFTAASSPEIEVRAVGSRIRVYVDGRPEAVIDVTNGTHNTLTFAGLWLDRIIVANGGVNPRVRWFMASGL